MSDGGSLRTVTQRYTGRCEANLSEHMRFQPMLHSALLYMQACLVSSSPYCACDNDVTSTVSDTYCEGGREMYNRFYFFFKIVQKF